MTPSLPGARRTGFAGPAPRPLVLVVENDANVSEMLQGALIAQDFRVITAADGEEAMRRALADRPDLVLLGVRLPRRGGLEVCDFLRHDPDDPHVPIILVSGSADTESRLEGLAHGADDYLVKPFSPRELIVRVQRLIARSDEARMQRQRCAELERDLARAHQEVRRAQVEASRERRLRELALGLGRELHRTLDLDALAERTLTAALQQTGARAAVLLAGDSGEGHGTPRGSAGTRERAGSLTPQSWRGDAFARWERLAIAPQGELATLLAGLGRPVLRADLERFPELRRECIPLVAAGVALLAPVRGAHGLDAVIALDERPDGAAFASPDCDALGALGEWCASARSVARRFRTQQDRALEMLAERVLGERTSNGRCPARERFEVVRAQVVAAARHLGLPARERGLLVHALAFGPWAWGDEGREALRRLAGDDPTGRVDRLLELMADAEALACADHATIERRRATQLAAAGIRWLIARASGRSALEGWDTALEWTGGMLDAGVREALESSRLTATGEHQAA